MSVTEERRQVLSSEEMDEALRNLAGQIADRYPLETIVFVGIVTRGATVAERVRGVLNRIKPEIQTGTLDISLYRDDLDRFNKVPSLESSDIPFAVDGARIILFDEVLFTGRTIRAALNGLLDYGRPAKIELAVLVDRGGRELPIQPDFVGYELDAKPTDYVQVRLQEVDDEEGVFISDKRPVK